MDAPGLAPVIVPITLAILIGLFLVQRRGTGFIGGICGPIMLGWFIVIGILGAGIAGILAPRLGLYTASTGGNIVAATLGALILLFLIGLVRRT